MFETHKFGRGIKHSTLYQELLLRLAKIRDFCSKSYDHILFENNKLLYYKHKNMFQIGPIGIKGIFMIGEI